MRLVKVRGHVAIAAVFLMVICAFGCGGGGGGGDNKNSGDGDGQGTANARASISGQSLRLNSSEIRQIDFAPTGSMWTEEQNGHVTGGTYQYTASGGRAELILTDSVGESTLHLEFTSPAAGTYRNLSTGAAGEFRLEMLESSGPGPNPGGEPGEPTGLALASLDGRTLYGTRTYTSTGPVGQTHVYTFVGGTYHDSDPPEESDGAYVYEPSGNRARLTLNYYAPQSFNGDHHDLELLFHSQSRGTFESTYTRRDGTVIQINGTFRIE